MRRRLTCCAGLLVGLVTVGTGLALAQENLSAYEILRRLSENKGQVTFEGERKIIRYQDGTEIVIKEIVKQQAPDKFMHVIIYPAQNAGTAELQTGQMHYNWGPGRAVVGVPNPLPQAEARAQRARELTELRLHHVLVREPDDEVAGRSAYVVLLRNRRSNLPYRRIWADKDKWLELKWQLFNPYTGRTEETAFYTALSFEPQFSSQDFAPPTQVRADMQNVVQTGGPRSADSAVLVPKGQSLPHGWTVQRQLQTRDRYGVGWMIVFRTATGFVSLTQRQAPAAAPGAADQQIVAESGSNTHAWRDDGRLFILTGRVTPTELSTLKRSLTEAAKAAGPAR